MFVLQILRQTLKEFLEYIIVQIFRDVIEKQPVTEVVLVSDLEYVPWIVLSRARRGKHVSIEWRTSASEKPQWKSIRPRCRNRDLSSLLY